MTIRRIDDFFLPHSIIDPNIAPLDNLYFENVDQEIDEVNDTYLRIKKQSTPNSVWTQAYVIMCVILGLPITLFVYNNNIAWSIVSVTILLLTLLYITLRKRAERNNKQTYECEFNRTNGNITFNAGILNNKQKCIPFSDCTLEAYYLRKGKICPCLVIKEPKHKQTIITFKSKIVDFDEGLSNIKKHHSFLQWYMDKTKPLPPGKIFDTYRNN